MTWIVHGFSCNGFDIDPMPFRTQVEASTYAKNLKAEDPDVYLNMYFMEDPEPKPPRSRWERLMDDDDFLE